MPRFVRSAACILRRSLYNDDILLRGGGRAHGTAEGAWDACSRSRYLRYACAVRARHFRFLGRAGALPRGDGGAARRRLSARERTEARAARESACGRAAAPLRHGDGRELDLAFRGLPLHHRVRRDAELLFCARARYRRLPSALSRKADGKADRLLRDVHAGTGAGHRRRGAPRRRGCAGRALRPRRGGVLRRGHSAQ